MMVTIEQLKQWFVRGAKPLQSQFHAWLDSYWHKSDKIDASSVEGLPELGDELAAHVQDRTNVHGVDAAQVGLGSVDNTSDMGKPVSTAQRTAIDAAKAGAESTAATALAGHTGNKSNPHAVTATQVGLGSVDNTSDKDKPVSTAQRTAIDAAKAGAESTAAVALAGHTGSKNNPHAVTKSQVGLGNVDNTPDSEKPVSVPQGEAIALAVTNMTSHVERVESDLNSAINGRITNVSVNGTLGNVDGNGVSHVTVQSGGGGGLKISTEDKVVFIYSQNDWDEFWDNAPDVLNHRLDVTVSFDLSEAVNRKPINGTGVLTFEFEHHISSLLHLQNIGVITNVLAREVSYLVINSCSQVRELRVHSANSLIIESSNVFIDGGFEMHNRTFLANSSVTSFTGGSIHWMENKVHLQNSTVEFITSNQDSIDGTELIPEIFTGAGFVFVQSGSSGERSLEYPKLSGGGGASPDLINPITFHGSFDDAKVLLESLPDVIDTQIFVHIDGSLPSSSDVILISDKRSSPSDFPPHDSVGSIDIHLTNSSRSTTIRVENMGTFNVSAGDDSKEFTNFVFFNCGYVMFGSGNTVKATNVEYLNIHGVVNSLNLTNSTAYAAGLEHGKYDTIYVVNSTLLLNTAVRDLYLFGGFVELGGLYSFDHTYIHGAGFVFHGEDIRYPYQFYNGVSPA